MQGSLREMLNIPVPGFKCDISINFLSFGKWNGKYLFSSLGAGMEMRKQNLITTGKILESCKKALSKLPHIEEPFEKVSCTDQIRSPYKDKEDKVG